MQNRGKHFRVACFLTAAAEEGMSAAEKIFCNFRVADRERRSERMRRQKNNGKFVGYGRRALEKARAA